LTNQRTTIPNLVDAGLLKNTTGLACVTKRDGRWLETSVDAFRAQIRQFALGLYDLGVRPGDRVALHAENCAEWLIVDQAVLRLGAVTVPIYTTQPGDQIAFILGDAEARVYIVSTAALFAGLAPHRNDLPTVETMVGIRGTFHPAMLAFEAVLDRGRRQPDAVVARVDRAQAAIQPDDLATLIYTSGTTGRPKGVMLTHRNLVSNVLAVEDRFPFDPDENRGGAMLSYLPLSHSLERIATLIYLSIGYPIHFIEDLGEILDDFKTVQPVHFTTVPRLLEKIHAGIYARAETMTGFRKALTRWALDLTEHYDVAHPSHRLRIALADRLVFKKMRTLFGVNLAAITSGGATLSPTVMTFFNAIGLFCGQGYGLTETSPVISLYKAGALKAGSAGIPLEDVEVRIADDGEILARGPNIMKGYYKQPDKTAEVISPDGWFHTGDVGHLDGDGHLFITDRKKELFKLSTGKYIAPTPIELALAQSPFVEQAVVVGNTFKFCAALVVLDVPAVRRHLAAETAARPEAGLTEHPLVLALIRGHVAAVNTALPHWEQIKKFCLLEQSFSIEGGELTPTLKVKRRVVHTKYRREIEGMYGE